MNYICIHINTEKEFDQTIEFLQSYFKKRDIELFSKDDGEDKFDSMKDYFNRWINDSEVYIAVCVKDYEGVFNYVDELEIHTDHLNDELGECYMITENHSDPNIDTSIEFDQLKDFDILVESGKMGIL